ncbi:MAG: neutral/alkaline non-lysosomal ceramidase N-terminal domain-containing protein [Acidobacteria bacterium]|nr:neutral/alkaline non-lysosomal ceramidase N-terminal domain-containing protein [Acidobacteriota bacterium]
MIRLVAAGWMAAAVLCAQSAWKAGVAAVDITPAGPIRLAGYAARTKPSQGVLRPLYVKALALRDETGRTSVIVTADLIGFRRDLSEAIAERAGREFGITRDRLLLNASHTHSGPVLGALGGPNYENYTTAENDAVAHYTRALPDKVMQAIGAAVGDLSPATLSFGQSLAAIAVNRRRAWKRELPGPVDHDVPVLVARAPGGRLRAVVAGYSCHATVLAGQEINGDWPGFAQEEIEKANPGSVALFVQGCGADANPLPRRSVDLARNYGRVLAAAVQEAIKGKMMPLTGPLRAAFATMPLPFQSIPVKEELQRRLQGRDTGEQRRARYLLKVLEEKGSLPESYPYYPVQVWRVGRELTLITLGGEVVVDYALRLKARYGWGGTWVAGYSNDMCGYIGSRRVIREGGYEGGGANTSNPSAWSEAIEDLIVDKVAELVRQSGG